MYVLGPGVLLTVISLVSLVPLVPSKDIFVSLSSPQIYPTIVSIPDCCNDATLAVCDFQAVLFLSFAIAASLVNIVTTVAFLNLTS